ncbi:DUF4143 domain-containing protein [Bdellovibrionota bacterium FG-2]
MNDYYECDFEFSYLRTKDDAEIDLIVRKPGNKFVLIEIKSSPDPQPSSYRHLISLGADLPVAEKWVLCNANQARQTDEMIRILPWREGLKELFEQTP